MNGEKLETLTNGEMKNQHSDMFSLAWHILRYNTPSNTQGERMSLTRILAIIFLLLAIGGSLVGYNQANPNAFSLGDYLVTLYAQLSTELIGIAVTVLVIDYLNEKREERRLRWQLIHELGSRNNDIADRAAYELRERGWLMDGSLQNADLHNADLSHANLANANLCHANLHGATLSHAELQNANLSETDLKGVNFTGANLQKADLRHSNITAEQLAQAYSLEGALLPDGVAVE